MSPIDVRKRVESVQNEKERTELYFDVLKEIAFGTAEQPRHCALEAIHACAKIVAPGSGKL